jgi:hypothetical protein
VHLDRLCKRFVHVPGSVTVPPNKADEGLLLPGTRTKDQSHNGGNPRWSCGQDGAGHSSYRFSENQSGRPCDRSVSPEVGQYDEY